MRKVKEKIKELYAKRKIRCTENSNKGFSLVELLVAIVILSVVVVPTMTVFITATKSNSKSRIQLQGTITANSVLESAKSFSLYVYSNQCNKAYTSSNQNEFTLIAGTTTQSLMAIGGTCGEVKLDTTSEAGKSLILAPSKGNTFAKEADQYIFAINGIPQSNSKYDALIVYDKNDYQEVSLGGSNKYTESNVKSEYDNYNKEYEITVYIYKHEDTPAYVGKDLKGDMGALITITGSKIDSALAPS